jgi:hypothetical protein
MSHPADTVSLVTVTSRPPETSHPWLTVTLMEGGGGGGSSGHVHWKKPAGLVE